MKRMVSVFAALMLVAGMASAAPSLYGSTGQIMTISPTNCGPMSWGIGAHGMFSMKEIDSTYSWMNIDAIPEGYFAFNDMLELSVAPGYRFFQNKATIAGTDTSWWRNGGLDTRIGLKATFLRGEGFNFGTYLGYDYRSARKWNYAGAYPWVTDAYEKVEEYSPTGAISFLLIPGIKSGNGTAYLNIGANYNLDKMEFDVAGTTVDYIYPKMDVPFGLGVGYDLGSTKLMLDVVGTAWVNDSTKYYKTDGSEYSPNLMNYPLWITPGLRFKLTECFKMDLGFAYNLQSDDSTLLGPGGNRDTDWMAIAGFSYSKCNLGPQVPPTAIISGKVVDKAGKGLAATVMAGGITANTDPATGAYTLSGVLIDKAPVEIKAEAKAYISKTASILLTKKNKKTPAVQDFTLELKPIPPSEVTGTIIDYKTGKPMANAALTFKGPKTVTATPDANGKYSVQLEQGTYAATAVAEGYNPVNFTVVAKDGKPVVQNTGLVKQKEKFSFSNINFASGKATITPEIETALQPLLKVLLDNPDLQVEISGHTDNIGSKAKNLQLSQARADAVVAWLITQNVKAKMTAKGYGSSQPIATNNTKAGRAENRRIEINVIQ